MAEIEATNHDNLETPNQKKRVLSIKFCLLMTIPIFLFCIYLTFTYFTPVTTISQIGEIITNYDSEDLHHFVFVTIKIPRVLGGIIVGAILAVGGAVMQGITRNYLADPSIVGVSSGAGLGLSFATLIYMGENTYGENILFSLIGSAISTVLIFYLSSRIQGRSAQTKLLLAGSALGTLFSSIAGIVNLQSGLGQSLAVWNNSGLLGMRWMGIAVLMLGVIGALIGFLIAGKITILGMGEETAIGLGENVKLTKLLGIIAVVLISAATVSTVGGIGFIGLIIPNMVKMVVGADYKKIIPISAVFGAVLLVSADVLSRLINPPFETPVGAITAVVGIPIFIYLVNSKKSGDKL